MEKILVADDEPDIRDVMRSILLKDGYQVYTASDGVSALALAKQEKPDLILLDFLMPGLNGIEVCAALKKDEATRNIPAIIITAYPGQKEEGLSAGAVDFVAKDADSFDVLLRIKSALKVRTIANELQRAIAYISDLEKQVRERKTPL